MWLHNLYAVRTKVHIKWCRDKLNHWLGYTERSCLLFRNALIPFTQYRFIPGRCTSTTLYNHSLTCGHWAAPLEQMGLWALLKGITSVLRREWQVLLFHLHSQVPNPAGPGGKTDDPLSYYDGNPGKHYLTLPLRSKPKGNLNILFILEVRNGSRIREQLYI